MTIISARYIKKPRRSYRCESCNKPLADHIYAYGHADDHTPPFGIRLHVGCALSAKDVRLQAAAEQAKQ